MQRQRRKEIDKAAVLKNNSEAQKSTGTLESQEKLEDASIEEINGTMENDTIEQASFETENNEKWSDVDYKKKNTQVLKKLSEKRKTF